MLVGGGQLSRYIAPGATSDGNVRGFIRYLAAATLDWADLLYVGRVVLARFRGDPTGTVAGTVHAMVTG